MLQHVEPNNEFKVSDKYSSKVWNIGPESFDIKKGNVTYPRGPSSCTISYENSQVWNQINVSSSLHTLDITSQMPYHYQESTQRKFEEVLVPKYTESTFKGGTIKETLSGASGTSRPPAVVNPNVPIKYDEAYKLWNSYNLDRPEAAVLSCVFKTKDLKRMKDGWFSNHEIDVLFNVLVEQHYANTNQQFEVIPSELATKWFYKGKIPENTHEYDYACQVMSKSFVTAIHVQGSPQIEESNHWILVCKAKMKPPYLYDPAGYEIVHKLRLRQNYEIMLKRCLRENFQIVWENYDKYHQKQQDSKNCGPLCLKEAERWLLHSDEKVRTDENSCYCYRIYFTNILLHKTNDLELLNYCLVCYSMIHGSLVKCVKCKRFLHASCKHSIKIKSSDSEYVCLSCVLLKIHTQPTKILQRWKQKHQKVNRKQPKHKCWKRKWAQHLQHKLVKNIR